MISGRKLRDSIKRIVKKWMGASHYRVFLFGSRVNGNATSRSDIDIGIEAGSRIDGAIMTEIRAEIDQLPVLQKVELVDFRSVSRDFRRIALERIDVIHEQ